MVLFSKFRAKPDGEIKYTYKVLRSIIALAVREVEGVFLLNTKSIGLKIIGKLIFTDIKILVSNSVNCTKVVFFIQENVKKTLENMTSFKVSKINVTIGGVLFDSYSQTDDKNGKSEAAAVGDEETISEGQKDNE